MRDDGGGGGAVATLTPADGEDAVDALAPGLTTWVVVRPDAKG